MADTIADVCLVGMGPVGGILANNSYPADFIDEESEKFKKLEAAVARAVERLREYRAALITAAVTGKIDVRDEVKAAA